MRLEIDIPEHHYNNIMALDSVCLGRAPYKGIIMYAINAIKQGKVLEQEPATKNDLGVEKIIDEIEKEFEKVDIPIMDKLTLFAKVQNALYKCAELRSSEIPTSSTTGVAEGFEWCDTCKEYDQEKHCCHRWTKVIRNTVEEMKLEYVEREVLDELRAEITTLQNRCYALTKGTMCMFCKYECKYKAENNS